MPEDDYTNFVGAWTDVLDAYFQPFVEFCFPRMARHIQWERGFKFRDDELPAIVCDPELGKQRVDKLVEVVARDAHGRETPLFIHVEIVFQKDPDLPHRLYQYNSRLSDHFGDFEHPDRTSVATLVILGDEDPNWKPKSYSYHVMGCGVQFDFYVCKLLEFEKGNDSIFGMLSDPT